MLFLVITHVHWSQKPLHLFLWMVNPAVSQTILNLWWTGLSAIRDVVKIRREGIGCTIPVLKETDHSRINLADILISRFSLTPGWPVFINFVFLHSFKSSVFNSSYLPRPSPLKRFPSEGFVSGSIFLFFSYPAQKALLRLLSSSFKAKPVCGIFEYRLLPTASHLRYHQPHPPSSPLPISNQTPLTKDREHFSCYEVDFFFPPHVQVYQGFCLGEKRL